MPDLLPITLDDQIASVERELAMRRRLYPRWVANRRITQANADREIALMQAVLLTLEGLRSPMPPAPPRVPTMAEIEAMDGVTPHAGV